MNKQQIVIVGAGPGGASAAVRLAQRGVRDVLLLDKDQFPREKTCGSALSPNGVQLIDELGIGDKVRELGYVIRSLWIVTPGQKRFKLTTDQAAIILLRKHFDNLLVEQAKRLGVEFRGNTKVTELVKEGGRVIGVKTKDGDVIHADLVIGADGAHSIFSEDQRPKRTISTLMGWWEGFPIEPNTVEMVFDKNLLPLYGWMFPENSERVNIGICMEGEDDANGREHDGRKKTTRNVREVFDQFLADHYGPRLKNARQIGKLKGHPISYTTWIRDLTRPGFAYLGEGGRMTHNATGEGIFQAMQSGCYAAEAAADIVQGVSAEEKAWQSYTWRCRQKFTGGFVMGHAIRGMLKTPLLEWVASAYNNPTVRNVATWALGSALGGTQAKATAEPIIPEVIEHRSDRAAAN
jgi:geranylgeranyl reductase family protein